MFWELIWTWSFCESPELAWMINGDWCVLNAFACSAKVGYCWIVHSQKKRKKEKKPHPSITDIKKKAKIKFLTLCENQRTCHCPLGMGEYWSLAHSFRRCSSLDEQRLPDPWMQIWSWHSHLPLSSWRVQGQSWWWRCVLDCFLACQAKKPSGSET